jgi:hypothetical protein
MSEHKSGPTEEKNHVWEIVSHILAGLIIFAVLAGAAVGIELGLHAFEDKISAPLDYLLHSCAFALAIADVYILVVFLAKSCYRLTRKL